MAKLNLKSVVWKEGDHYISQCLDVGVSSFGKTKKEALELYFEDMPVPVKSEVSRPTIESVTLKIR